MDLAMQLAAIRFLREVMGTRDYPGLESLLAEGGMNMNLAGNKRKAQDSEDEDEGEGGTRGATRPAARNTWKSRCNGERVLGSRKYKCTCLQQIFCTRCAQPRTLRTSVQDTIRQTAHYRSRTDLFWNTLTPR